MFCEYDVAAFYYWGKMTKEERSAQRSIIIPWVLSESDYLDFERFTGLQPSITFQYFWLLLTNDERFDVARTYFLDFYRFMIYHEDGLHWIHDFLDSWNPSLSPIDYFKVLRISFDTNNPQLFELLWKRKLAHLSAEVVGHLLWVRENRFRP